jgi:hypothetical protein
VASLSSRTRPPASAAAPSATRSSVDHADHDAAARAHLTGLAAELGLLTTGSSDFHGTNKTVRLGENVTDRETYDRLVAAAGSATAVLTA